MQDAPVDLKYWVAFRDISVMCFEVVDPIRALSEEEEDELIQLVVVARSHNVVRMFQVKRVNQPLESKFVCYTH